MDFWEQSSAADCQNCRPPRNPFNATIHNAGEKLSKALLEADEGEHSESEASEDDDVAQVLHRLDHCANDRLEA